MARVRTEKGRTAPKAANEPKLKPLQKEKDKKEQKDAPKSKGKGKSKAGLSQADVLALGGDARDFALVKDVDSEADGADEVEDPALKRDVSAFLTGLQIGDQAAEEIPQPKAKTKKTKATPAEDIVKKASSKPQPKAKKPEPAPAPAPAEQSQKPPARAKVLLEPTAAWYATPLPQLHSPAPPAPTPAQLAQLSARAADLHAAALHAYGSSSASASAGLTSTPADSKFLSQILASGTLSDRLSALTLLVQSAPVYNTRALDTLAGMGERGKGGGGRGEGLKALRCVVDWWVGGGVPGRKLKYLRDQPLLHPSVTDSHLVLWYFEDWLKKWFFGVLRVLETLSLDPLPYVRTQSLTLISNLLRSKPEQEHNLLRLLVNKLGDTDKSICARASHHLLTLVQSHPAMKSVVVREITALVLRPATAAAPSTSTSTNTHLRFGDGESKHKKKKEEPKKEVNAHARYYATITLNQLVLNAADREVALALIGLYFEMFKEILGEGRAEEGEPDADEEDDKDKKGKARRGKDQTRDKDDEGEEKPKDERLPGTAGRYEKKGKGKQGKKETRGAAGFAEVEDAHSRLVSAILTGVNRALPFAKIGAADSGIHAHIDTLFLITHTSTFNISLQALLLVQHIAAALALSPTPALRSTTDRFYRTLYASLHDPRLAVSSKQAMYLNLLFKSLKADPDVDRVRAFVRRLVQILGGGGGGATEFVAGGLYLLGELFGAMPGLRDMLKASAEGAAAEGPYDPRKREPQFAHAGASPLWELIPLTVHYHPAIALNARQLLAAQPLTASADLAQNTLGHFLDRFVYKNPKKAGAQPKGDSAMQPAANPGGADGTVVRLLKGEVQQGAPVNEERFWRKKREDVPVDEMFFHTYFAKKNEKGLAKSAKVDKRRDHESEEEVESAAEEDDEDGGDSGEDVGDSDGGESDEESASLGDAEDAGDASEDSDAEEAEIWKAMQSTMPKEAGDGDLLEDSDSDSDDVPSDLEEAMGSESEADDDSGPEDVSEPEDDAENSDALSMVEGSDNEDLLDLDEEVPMGLIDFDGSDAEEEEEWGGVDAGKKRKRASENKEKNEKRKKLRSLPTFASYEDYAKLIDDGPEDDI